MNSPAFFKGKSIGERTIILSLTVFLVLISSGIISSYFFGFSRTGQIIELSSSAILASAAIGSFYLARERFANNNNVRVFAMTGEDEDRHALMVSNVGGVPIVLTDGTCIKFRKQHINRPIITCKIDKLQKDKTIDTNQTEMILDQSTLVSVIYKDVELLNPETGDKEDVKIVNSSTLESDPISNAPTKLFNSISKDKRSSLLKEPDRYYLQTEDVDSEDPEWQLREKEDGAFI